jgi:hypothetical protein
MRVLAVAVLVLALAPAADAWTTVSSGALSNTVDPSALRTRSGAELVVYASPGTGTISLVRNGSSARVLVSGDPIAGNARLVQQPGGALELYYPDGAGIARISSTDDGATWSAPARTLSHDVGPVQAAAVRADGTPLFSQDGTGFLDVFSGLNGESVENVFSSCCGYAESLAVDSTGLAQVAFWSNASGNGGYLYGPVGGALRSLSGGKDTVPNDARVPLVADASGDTFAAWLGGYPTPNAFVVQTFRSGSPVGSVTLWRAFRAPAQMALALEPNGKLWALWTAGGAVHAARSRSHGAHFGAPVTANLPAGATAYQLEGLARPGSVTALVNVGASLAAQKLLPGLAVSLKRMGKLWTATVTDDRVGVPNAPVRGGGHTLHTNAKGRVSLAGLPHHLTLRVTAGGYASTRFRIP